MKDKFKIIFLGDTSVGKTSLIRRKTENKFTDQMNPTIGADSTSITINIEETNINLVFWDTAGQEKYSSLVPMYVRGADIAIIVASIENGKSIKHITKWSKTLSEASDNLAIFLVINKIDLPVDKYEYSEEQINTIYGKKYSEMFFVSAATAEGVDAMFEEVAKSCLHLHEREGFSTLNIEEHINSKQSCC